MSDQRHASPGLGEAALSIRGQHVLLEFGEALTLLTMTPADALTLAQELEKRARTILTELAAARLERN